VRYGVSRSILREAVRLLEYHSIARMRRGPGGGLVVTEPQVRASINAIALYLEYRRPHRDDLCLVRDAIEVDNVARVVRRHGDADVRAFIEAHRTMAQDPGVPHDLAATARQELQFHARVSELVGNSVITLFQRILVELLRRRWDSAGADRTVPEGHEAAEIGHDHAAIIEAVAAGDDAVARYRTRRHMQTATSWWW
jgi:DNA-binding FadR family transcriptional regulator